MAKKLRLKRRDLVKREEVAVEVVVVVVLEVAAGMEVAVEVEAEAGICPVTITANQGICQEIAIEMEEEGLVEAEVVVVAEEAAIIVEERDTSNMPFKNIFTIAVIIETIE